MMSWSHTAGIIWGGHKHTNTDKEEEYVVYVIHYVYLYQKQYGFWAFVTVILNNILRPTIKNVG